MFSLQENKHQRKVNELILLSLVLIIHLDLSEKADLIVQTRLIEYHNRLQISCGKYQIVRGKH